jgi:hypothetical protein
MKSKVNINFIRVIMINITLLFLLTFSGSLSAHGSQEQTSYYYRETKLFFNQIVVKSNHYRVQGKSSYWASWNLIPLSEEDSLSNFCFHNLFYKNEELKKMVDSIEIKRIMMNMDSANAIQLNTTFLVNARFIKRPARINMPYYHYTVPIFFLNYNYAISFEGETNKFYSIIDLYLYRKSSGKWTRERLLCSLQS